MGRKISGTLYKRGTVWWLKWVEGGKLYRLSTDCSNRRDAVQKRVSLIQAAEYATSQVVPCLDAGRIKTRNVQPLLFTANDSHTTPLCSAHPLALAWETLPYNCSLNGERYQLKDRCIKRNESFWRRFMAYVAEHHPAVTTFEAVTPAVIDGWCAHMGENGAGAAALNIAVVTIRAMYKLRDIDWIYPKFRKFREIKRSRRMLTMQEVAAILANTTIEESEYLIASRIAEQTGASVVNCASIVPRNINASLGTVEIGEVTQKLDAQTMELVARTIRKKQGAKILFQNLRVLIAKEGIANDNQLRDAMEIVRATKGREWKLLIRLALYTGLRFSDCCTLQWRHVDMTEGIVSVETAKTGKVVSLPIHPALLAEFQMAKQATGGQGKYVLPVIAEVYHSCNRRRLVQTIAKIWYRAGVETKEAVSGRQTMASVAGFHALRHTFVSLCAKGGISEGAIRNWVGHTSPVVNRIYQHWAAKDAQGISLAIPMI